MNSYFEAVNLLGIENFNLAYFNLNEKVENYEIFEILH